MKSLLTWIACFVVVIGLPACQRKPISQASVIEVWEQGEPVPQPWGYSKQSMYWRYQQMVFLDDGNYVSRSTWRTGNMKPITNESKGSWLYLTPGGNPAVKQEDKWVPVGEPLQRVYRYEAPAFPPEWSGFPSESIVPASE